MGSNTQYWTNFLPNKINASYESVLSMYFQQNTRNNNKLSIKQYLHILALIQENTFYNDIIQHQSFDEYKYSTICIFLTINHYFIPIMQRDSNIAWQQMKQTLLFFHKYSNLTYTEQLEINQSMYSYCKTSLNRNKIAIKSQNIIQSLTEIDQSMGENDISIHFRCGLYFLQTSFFWIRFFLCVFFWFEIEC